jgi:hypothetical protein
MKKGFWLGLLLLAGSSVAQAQVRPDLKGARISAHPLTAREGKAVVSAAWEWDQQAMPKPDCSHLVHDVYTSAGYPYPYARSVDLYVGTRSFVRVARPQPGDLVVWRGHVGIVVDPVAHSFYSSVSSGLRIEFYDAPEWKARGFARYYRYLSAKSANPVLTGNYSAKTRKDAASTINQPDADSSEDNLPTPAQAATRQFNTQRDE